MMIKNDINLLPARKRLPAYITVGIPFGVVLLVVLLAAGIYFPSASLNSKQEKLDSLKLELTEYADINVVYVQKFQELQTLQANRGNYNDFFSGERHVLEMSNMLFEIMPEEITISQFDFVETGFTISGIALSDLIIADFEETLWDTGAFSEIGLGTISGAEEERTFVFTLTYFQGLSNGGEN